MSNANEIKAMAALAQCASYKAGIATFRAFVAKHQFEARDIQGRSMLCLTSKDVLLLLDCIEADAEDAADRQQTQGASA